VGTAGIGLATAKRFIAEGATVFITGRRHAELDKAAEELGDGVIAVQGDVSKPEDLDRLYAAVADRGEPSTYCSPTPPSSTSRASVTSPKSTSTT
jgi:NAD(P)-dependent dehydrogenase (short-subunit alcohol dehydrogenase family)